MPLNQFKFDTLRAVPICDFKVPDGDWAYLVRHKTHTNGGIATEYVYSDGVGWQKACPRHASEWVRTLRRPISSGKPTSPPRNLDLHGEV